jgi:hypothetical protein
MLAGALVSVIDLDGMDWFETNHFLLGWYYGALGDVPRRQH